MSKKIFLTIFLIIILRTPTLEATESEFVQEELKDIDIENYIDNIKNITGEQIDLNKIFDNSLNGKLEKNIIINFIGEILGQELRQCFQMIISILIVIIIHSILKSICENFGNEQTGKIGYFVQIIILITMLVKVYGIVLENVKQTLSDLSNLIYIILPLYMSLVATTGNITAATNIDIIILLSSNLITNFINQIVIPFVIVATTLGIISNISDQLNLNKLAKYIKSIIIWLLCIFLTIFTCTITLEANLGQSVDNVASKTGKTIVSSFVPIVGKILGDSMETVLSCTTLIKNSVGIIGIIAVISVGIVPIIRISILTIFLYLIGGVSEIIADKKVVYALEQMGDTCKVLLASVCSLSMMLIIGLTITMRIGI